MYIVAGPQILERKTSIISVFREHADVEFKVSIKSRECAFCPKRK